MIDINAEVEKTLSKLDYHTEYYYPQKFNDLPIVSFYNLTESAAFGSDNEEDIQGGTVVIDIWTDSPDKCGEIGLKVNDVMVGDDWCREFSRDIKPNNGIYHRTMRVSKNFVL